MKKIIKRYGDSLIIRLTKDDCDIYKLHEGDVIEMTIIKEVSNGNRS